MNKLIIFSLSFCAIMAVTLAAPTDKVVELSNEIIPQGEFKRDGDSVSASWGGFQASAGLSDTGAVASAGGNGLGAGAGYGIGGIGANAGVAGTGNKQGAAYGVGSIGQPGHQGVIAGQGFFDRIFAIPINVLQSVNTYLNQRPTAVRKAVVVSNGGNGYVATAGKVGDVNKVSVSETVATASSGAEYGNTGVSVAGASASAGSGPVVQKNYDQVFNIPITALRSVQNLLNGKK
ncbi:glycine-rich protein 1-like [Daktulosphaira vitifoliae]|uniref:glycine-rich protein 1-like n=1 Tax=Daktulosphaira vitifoliae TaxID=58002 RepID=UPI0021A9E237|nr:glycine-rich protein 1-like [Daktulosphaira vitifoliae]